MRLACAISHMAYLCAFLLFTPLLDNSKMQESTMISPVKGGSSYATKSLVLLVNISYFSNLFIFNDTVRRLLKCMHPLHVIICRSACDISSAILQKLIPNHILSKKLILQNSSLTIYNSSINSFYFNNYQTMCLSLLSCIYS